MALEEERNINEPSNSRNTEGVRTGITQDEHRVHTDRDRTKRHTGDNNQERAGDYKRKSNTHTETHTAFRIKQDECCGHTKYTL